MTQFKLIKEKLPGIGLQQKKVLTVFWSLCGILKQKLFLEGEEKTGVSFYYCIVFFF